MGICRDINQTLVMETEMQARLTLWFIGTYTSYGQNSKPALSRDHASWTWEVFWYFSMAQTYFQAGAHVDSFYGQSPL